MFETPDKDYEAWRNHISFREWRVFEKNLEGKGWSPHGQIHYDPFEAVSDLKEKRERYSKYGRRFQLRTRAVEYWTPCKPLKGEIE